MILRSIISDSYTIFLSAFCTIFLERMDTNLSISTTLHLQTDGNIEVVNKTLVQLLRG